jgi:hypothetical protein
VYGAYDHILGSNESCYFWNFKVRRGNHNFIGGETMKGRMLLIVLVLLILSPQAFSQVCGDANGDGYVSISDITLIFNYLYYPSGYPTLRSEADCDNRTGVTIGDAQAITDYVFFGGLLDCSIQDVYTFPPSQNDTIFLPYMVDIPDGVDSVKLPVITSFETGTRSVYIPTLTQETNGPGLFNPSRVDKQSGLLGLGRKVGPDTTVMMVCEVEELAGRHSFFELVFHRLQPGLAAITCASMIRNETLELVPSVIKNGGDLYTPVIQYYQVPTPTPVVTVSPSPLHMETKAGFWSTASYEVTFTSDLGSVSFKLAASDSWIAIDGPAATVYTTPATITVRANASALAAGDYSGQITFTDITPADAGFLPAVLDVTLSVVEPTIYPPGDLNCDGYVTIGDVSLLIDCLFINTRPVPACE